MAGSSTGWGHRALVEVAEVNPETLGAGTPAGQEFRYVDLSAVDRGRIDWSSVSKTTFRSAPSRARRVVRGGDVLFGTVRPSLQSHGAIPAGWADHVVASTGFAVIRAKEGMANARFLFHWVLSPSVTALARRAEVGSNYPAVNESDIARFVVHAPPIEEQRRIAEVLDTLGEATQKTEQVIAKLKQLKQGLLHDLLTRGIDENGELRDPERYPKQFAATPLGRLPQSWQLASLGEVAVVAGGVTLGRSLSGPGTVELPYLRVANVQDGYLDLTEIKTVRILSAEEERFSLKPGDVLMNEGGDFDKLGRGSVWRGQIDRCLHQNHVFRVRPSGLRLRSDFLASFTASPIGKSYFLRASKQTTNLASINSTQLKAMPVPLPTPHEQEQIERTLQQIDDRVTREERACSKLNQLKAGLMEDLLTGRVRVADPREGAPA